MTTLPPATTPAPGAARTSPPAAAADVARFRANLQGEIDSAAIYGALAGAEHDPTIADVFRRMAETETRHAAFWQERLRAAGAPSSPPRPTWRARTLVRIARRFGSGLVLPTLMGNEARDRGGYSAQPEASGTSLPADEQSHALLLSAVAAHPRGVAGPTLARIEGRHRAVGGNALRAAVLGANDGLVSNLSLVMGVAGAEVSGRALLITGLAGLLAGACSMAMGEWLSVQSSRELNVRQIAVEREELAAAPEEERDELALIYQAKGLPAEQARQLADRIVADPTSALDTLAREELGIDPRELGGSAIEAAVTSFILFAIGAIIPVVPFLFLSGGTAILTSIALSGAGLFLIGGAITLFTGRSVLFSGARQLAFGLGAAALTYGIGRLIGVNIGG